MFAIIHDDVLGVCTYNTALDWYEATITYQGAPLQIGLSVQDADISVVLVRARGIVAHLPEYALRAAEYATAELLPLKNDAWREDDEQPLTAAEFQARMRLASITIESNLGAAFFYHDGDLFWGHTILVSMDAHDQWVSADIPG